MVEAEDDDEFVGQQGGGRRLRRYSGGDLAPLHSQPPTANVRPDALRRHASQATMWYTTVPQPVALAEKPLGSRHAPTRRSLRRSRTLGQQMKRREEEPQLEMAYRAAIGRQRGREVGERGPQNCHVIAKKVNLAFTPFFRAGFTLRSLFPVLPTSSPASATRAGGGGRAGPSPADLGLCLALGLAQLALGLALLASSAAATAADVAWASPLAPNAAGLLVTISKSIGQNERLLSSFQTCLSGWTSVPLVACHKLVFKRVGTRMRIRTSYSVLILILTAASLVACLVSFGVLSAHLYRLYLAVPLCSELERTSCLCGRSLVYAMSCESVRQALPPALTASSAATVAGALLAAWQAAHVVAIQRRSHDLVIDDLS